MAVYNEILAARYANMLRKLFSMRGGNPAKQLGSEVMPAINVFSGAENRFLEQWDRYGAVITQPAVAANFSAIRFRNAAGSNVVAVFEKIWFSGSVTDLGLLSVGAATADLATLIVLVQSRFDNRSRPQSSLVVSRTALGAGVTPAQWQGNFLANAGVDVITTDIQEFPLMPGDQLTIGSNTVNTALNVSFFWRERFLEESERQ